MDERYRVLKNSSEVSELNGIAFEEYLTQLFNDLGYKTTKTPASGDYGADVLLHDGDKQIVIQAKQYASSVGFEAIKEAYFALGYYDADEAWVVATSSFTPQAINAAKKTGIKLISGSDLDTLIIRARNRSDESSLRKQTPIETEQKAAEPAGVGAAERRAAGCSTKNGAFVLHGRKTETSGQVLTSYTGNSSIVETPMGVDAIGDGAFSNCSLRKIVIHEGVKFIGDGAFANCKNLEFVQLPSTLVSIGDDAFSDCGRLESIQLPAALASIGNRAFLNCSNLEEVVLPDGLRSIGDSAFEHSGVTAISFPKSLETIGTCAFAWSALVTANLDSGIEEIPEEAFSSCLRLSHIILPQGVKRIGLLAFTNTPITSIDFPNSLEDICHYAFASCDSLKHASLPDSIKNVCCSAFGMCKSLEDPDLDDAFYAPVIVQDETIPAHMAAKKLAPDAEQLVSERDTLFHIDCDFEIGDFAISANEKGLASYALLDDSEFEKGWGFTDLIDSAEPTTATLRRGAYLYLSHATARRLGGAPAYVRDVQKNYENAIRMYESGRFEECRDLVFNALLLIKNNDEVYREFKEREINRVLEESWKQTNSVEVPLNTDFGLKSGFSVLLLSKLQVLDDCMTCRTDEGYYNPEVSLFGTVERILSSQIDKSPANDQAEFCEFAFRLVYENSVFAYGKAEEEIRDCSSGCSSGLAVFEKERLDESRKAFKKTLSLIVQRTVDLSKSPDFDIRFLSYVHRILSSQERGVLGEKMASDLDEYLTTVLHARLEEEYQKRFQQLTSELTRQIDILDVRREEVRSSRTALSFISPAKARQRKTALKEIDNEKAALQDELNRSEHIVSSMLWKSLENQHLDRSF